MAQQWPTTAPSVSPGTHDPVATQAYQAGGGDYFRSGYYSHGLFTSAATATQALTLSRLYARAFPVPVRRTFDRVGVDVSTAATAASGGLLRMGVYDTSDGLPGALMVDGGTVSSESTGAKEATVSLTLDPGVYWLVLVAQIAVCTVRSYNSNTAWPWGAWSSVSTAPPTGVGFPVPYRSSVTGALPLTFDAPTSVTTGPLAVCLRAA